MRIAGAIGLLVVGAVTGLATTAVHEVWWGLLLGAAATAATLVALDRGWSARLPFALGWVGLVAWVLPPRSEGDFVVSGDTQGYSLLVLAVAVLVFALVTLPRPGLGSSGRSHATEGRP